MSSWGMVLEGTIFRYYTNNIEKSSIVSRNPNKKVKSTEKFPLVTQAFYLDTTENGLRRIPGTDVLFTFAGEKALWNQLTFK